MIGVTNRIFFLTQDECGDDQLPLWFGDALLQLTPKEFGIDCNNSRNLVQPKKDGWKTFKQSVSFLIFKSCGVIHM